MRPAKFILAIFLFALSSQVLSARINVVTLPRRDSVQLTIYNSVDLTMVKETRFLTLRKGMNHLEFSWANTLIDPTSVEFKALTHASEVEVLDVRFPPRVSNTLEWHIQSEVVGEVQVEIRYFTSGVSWSAAYVAEVAQNELSMKLNGAVKVTNNSGEDYENTQVRLIVGVIRLVEEISQLSRRGNETEGKMNKAYAAANTQQMFSLMDSMVLSQGATEKPREVSKESLSEYYVYTVEGRDTIPNGWSKMLPSFSKPGVAFASYYKYEKEQFGETVQRFCTFTNDTAGNLGSEPLPEGILHAFRLSPRDSLYTFQGASAFQYIPINEKAELNFGPDPEVRIHPKMMSWEKTDLRFDNHGDLAGWTVTEKWEVELQNSKEIPVMADVRRNFTGDWTLVSASNHEKLDATKVKFLIPLAPHSAQTVSYQLTLREGTNATH